MTATFLLDSNVLVDYLRNRSEAVDFLTTFLPFPEFRRSPSQNFMQAFAKGWSEKFWTISLLISWLLRLITRLP